MKSQVRNDFFNRIFNALFLCLLGSRVAIINSSLDQLYVPLENYNLYNSLSPLF